MEPTPYMTVKVADIGEAYADLRIIQPQAEGAMERSLRLYGQMTPVILGRGETGAYEMVDGFKRLRAGRKLGFSTLDARTFQGSAARRGALKAAIIHLNNESRTLAELETGMVIRSLHREDGLSQVEIGVLLGRHKSFVCRRLRMVEALSDEVLEHLKLGLVSMTIGRELARLPRGNQASALRTVIKHRLTSRETSRLVATALSRPRWDHDAILRFPEEILTERQPPVPPGARGYGLFGKLAKMELSLVTISDAELQKHRHEELLPFIERIFTALSQIRERMEASC